MKLLILGAGGYGRTIADIAKQSGEYTEVNFLDDNSTAENVIGKCADYLKFTSLETEIYPAFGNNEVRVRWLDQLEASGVVVPIIVHSTAYVSPEVVLESGVTVLPHAVVNTGTKVNEGCIINIGAIVDHDCILEPGAHIALGAIVKGENCVASCEKIESGVVVDRATMK